MTALPPAAALQGRVLIVDDEELVGLMLQLWLEEAGYEVHRAMNFDQACACMGRARYDLVTLDVVMPGTDGIGCLRWIRQHHGQVGVIMATALGEMDLIVEAMRLGAYSYMIKPLRYDLVRHEMARAMERQRLLAERHAHQQQLELQVQTQTQELRAAYAALERQYQELEEQRVRALQADRLQALGEMAAGIAHELHQPLNGIRAFAEGALYGIRHQWSTTPEQSVETFRDIVAQVDRMAAIVDHMRVFARDSSQAAATAFSMAAMVEGALKLVRAQLRLNGIGGEVEIEPDLPLVMGHAGQIEQVLLNLIANARDALVQRRQRGQISAAWQPVLTVNLATDTPRSSVRLTVSDNGGGVPQEMEARVFDPFFTTKEVGRGTGIGLSISRAIVERHGGALDLANRPGVGATFTVTLPAAG